MIVKYLDPDDFIHQSISMPPGTSFQDLQDRAGETWWQCDVKSCDNEGVVVETGPPSNCTTCGNSISGNPRYCPNCGTVVLSASGPDDWVTSDPDGDPYKGGAQFCPTHAHYQAERTDEVVEEPAPAPTPEPAPEE